MFPPFPPRQPQPTAVPSPVLVLSRPPVTAWHDVWITADPIEVSPALIGVFGQTTGEWVRRPELDLTLTVAPIEADPLDENDEEDVGGLAVNLLGSWLEVTIFASPLSADPALLGTYASGVIVVASSNIITANPALRYAGITLQTAATGEHAGSNVLRWSKVRTLDFTIDRSNMAGQAALPWKGTVYAMLRRGEQVVVYGRNGVGALSMAGQGFDMQPLLGYGLKSKLAVCDTGEAHYFVDTQNRLWKLGQGLELLDYREWLSTLGGTIAITFNPDTRLLYIGDGTAGYLYNVDTGSMGKGPATVTGIGLQDGTLYVVASGTMTIPNFAITTDIRDFGTRKAKTIRYLEIGVDTTLTLEGSIDYRLEKHGSFASLDWYPFDSRGHCYLNCYGYEFRIKVRATSAGWFHPDYLNAFGVVHAH